MCGIIELDENMLIARAMTSAACADHESELGPVLDCAGPLRETDRCAVDAHEAAAGIDEIGQVLPEFGVGETIADGVVEEDSVELLEVFALEHVRVTADGGLEGAGLLAHQGEGE